MSPLVFFFLCFYNTEGIMNVQEIPYGCHNIFNKTEIKSKFNFMILSMLGGYDPTKKEKTLGNHIKSSIFA